jgi:hypothetical protein
MLAVPRTHTRACKKSAASARTREGVLEMGVETIRYTVLAVIVVAIPVAIVLGTAVLLAVGGVIGCTKCLVASIGAAEPVTTRETAKGVGPRFA